MYEAVILAAGYSSRVGVNKMMLLIDNKPILSYVIEAFYPLCDRIHVVSGHYHSDILSLCTLYPKVNIIYNKDYHLGMFSSLLCAVKEVKDDCFVCPGDYPFITTDMAKELAKGQGDFIVPTFKGIKGHPVLIRKTLLGQLSKEPISSNLKAFRNRQEITYIAVNSQGILEDIDTMESYEKIKMTKKGVIET